MTRRYDLDHRRLGRTACDQTRSSRSEECLRASRAISDPESGGDWLIDRSGDRRQLLRYAAVIVPIARRSLRATPDLHKPSASLDQPASQQTAAAEVFRGLVGQTVGCVCRFALLRDIKGLRSGQLHAAASSYDLIRASSRESCGFSAACSAFSFRSNSKPSRSAARVANWYRWLANKSGTAFFAPALMTVP